LTIWFIRLLNILLIVVELLKFKAT